MASGVRNAGTGREWVYAERARLVGAITLMVNYPSNIDGSFGGAMVVSPEGEIRHELSPGVSGILVGEIDV